MCAHQEKSEASTDKQQQQSRSWTDHLSLNWTTNDLSFNLSQSKLRWKEYKAAPPQKNFFKQILVESTLKSYDPVPENSAKKVQDKRRCRISQITQIKVSTHMKEYFISGHYVDTKAAASVKATIAYSFCVKPEKNTYPLALLLFWRLVIWGGGLLTGQSRHRVGHPVLNSNTWHTSCQAKHQRRGKLWLPSTNPPSTWLATIFIWIYHTALFAMVTNSQNKPLS